MPTDFVLLYVVVMYQMLVPLWAFIFGLWIIKRLLLDD